MTTRTIPPFRADHVGSLLRPERLREARARFRADEIDGDELRAVEDEAIRDAIAMQHDVGLRSATDGEMRRTTWRLDFILGLDGISQVADESVRVDFRNEQVTDYTFTPKKLRVDGAIALREPIFADAFSFLRDNVADGITPKLTIPSPSMVHYRGGDSSIDRDVYPDTEEFWSDLTSAYHEEVLALHDLGCRYLQLDDTSLAYMNDPQQRNRVAELGGDPEHLHEQYIANINRALAGRPEDLTVTTHLCRGNHQSMWAAEGGYDFVAEALFGQLEVDGYFLEFDDERSGTFEPLRFVPKGKMVVLGLVTSKRPELESRDLLKRRIEEASRYVDIDQLCLSPQCGFSSTEEGNKLTIDDERRKLELVVQTAAEVWA